MKILILCTGNSCRSQMAHGFLQSFDTDITVCSAGTNPANRVSSRAIEVMKEAGVDISNHFPKSVDQYLDEEWDYVITVCDHANETCPVFSGKVKHRLHIGFDDPSHAVGSEEFIWSEFRRVRDEIKKGFYDFYTEQIKTRIMNAKDLKLVVKKKYSEIAEQSKIKNEKSCCETSCCCSTPGVSDLSERYDSLEGYNPDADLALGCGLPTQFANIKAGDSVLDLGSGAGNDCFVARAIVGESGQVTGIDFTDAMLEKARNNAAKHGFGNVTFIKGDIENMPLPDNQYDVVVSNCVLNLVPDKMKAFKEVYRILKQGGHFCVSDIVIKGSLPKILQKNAELYAGCVSGAIDLNDYLKIIEEQGFQSVTIHKQKEILLPDELLSTLLSPEEINDFKTSNTGIFSITISGTKK